MSVTAMKRPDPLPIHAQIAHARAAIEVLETASRAWKSFAPGVAAIDSAVIQCDAVGRSLRQLRPSIVAEIEAPEPPRAA
jgi:hypothetical protein